MSIPQYYRNTLGAINLIKHDHTSSPRTTGLRTTHSIKVSDQQVIDIRTKSQKENLSLSQLSSLYPQISRGYLEQIIRYDVRNHPSLDVW